MINFQAKKLSQLTDYIVSPVEKNKNIHIDAIFGIYLANFLIFEELRILPNKSYLLASEE